MVFWWEHGGNLFYVEFSFVLLKFLYGHCLAVLSVQLERNVLQN